LHVHGADNHSFELFQIAILRQSFSHNFRNHIGKEMQDGCEAYRLGE
jgi:hypothetical protein